MTTSTPLFVSYTFPLGRARFWSLIGAIIAGLVLCAIFRFDRNPWPWAVLWLAYAFIAFVRFHFRTRPDASGQPLTWIRKKDWFKEIWGQLPELLLVLALLVVTPNSHWDPQIDDLGGAIVAFAVAGLNAVKRT